MNPPTPQESIKVSICLPCRKHYAHFKAGNRIVFFTQRGILWKGMSQSNNSEIESSQHHSWNSWEFITAGHCAEDTVEEKGVDSVCHVGYRVVVVHIMSTMTMGLVSNKFTRPRYIGKVLTERKDGPGSRSAFCGNTDLRYRCGHIDPYRRITRINLDGPEFRLRNLPIWWSTSCPMPITDV